MPLASDALTIETLPNAIDKRVEVSSYRRRHMMSQLVYAFAVLDCPAPVSVLEALANSHAEASVLTAAAAEGDSSTD